MSARIYLAVIEELKAVVSDGPLRYADIGGATGRLIYEWLTAFPKTAEAFYCEPSAMLAEWGENLLSGNRQEWMPIVHERDRPSFQRVAGWPSPIALDRLKMSRARAEGLPRPEAYFDVATSLNVIDRVADPSEYVRTVARLVRPDGYLALATPFDWKTEYTSRNKWVEDVTVLLPPDWEAVQSRDLEYDIRSTHRDVQRYLSQLIIARRRRKTT
jgi:SAM-dependent methyltransferase